MPGVEEIEQVVKDTDLCEKEDESLDDDQQKTNIQNEHQSSGNALPITSLQSNRCNISLLVMTSDSSWLIFHFIFPSPCGN